MIEARAQKKILLPLDAGEEASRRAIDLPQRGVVDLVHAQSGLQEKEEG